MTAPQPDATAADLDACARERIHLLNNIQDFGCLLVTSTDWIVTRVSTNIEALTGLGPRQIVGQPLSAVLPEETCHLIRNRVQLARSSGALGRAFGVDLCDDGRLFDISAHESDGRYILEFEAKHKAPVRDVSAEIPALMSRVRAMEDMGGFLNTAARMLRTLSGFDRVMVYRFEADGSGTVVAEDARRGARPYRGLRFPAGDIPPQARALYLRQPLRLIADVAAPVHPIWPEFGAEGQPLDLSMAVTRAVSPVHIEYLRNMGVAASMSVSIIDNGQLWGLLSCHHNSPRLIDFELRTAIELYGQLFSYELNLRTRNEELAHIDAVRRSRGTILDRIRPGSGAEEWLGVLEDKLAPLIGFDGLAFLSPGRATARGLCPDTDTLSTLRRFLDTADPAQVFATSAVGQEIPAEVDPGPQIAGFLAIPLARDPRDYLVFFRREIAQAVSWGGDPAKTVESGPDGRISPRKSFESWKEIVRGQSAPWTPQDRAVGAELRTTLLEVILSQRTAAADLSRAAADHQELVVGEMNHRLKNILELVRALANRGRDEATSIEGFAATLDGRIRALAQAHDLLSAPEKNASVGQILAAECAAFAGGAEDRITLPGTDIGLSEAAATTVALVVHELLSNALKHGALGARPGTITVGLEPLAKGGAVLTWFEEGPSLPEEPPQRHGFGRTVLDRALSQQLGGRSEVEIGAGRLLARFTLPAGAVRPLDEDQAPARTAPPPAALLPERFGGRALVLDDNLLLAVELSETLTRLGVTETETVGTVADALSSLAATRPDFAVLDMNLGDETSGTVAERLTDLGIPYIFSTGYGDAPGLRHLLPSAPVIEKPIDDRVLLDALHGLAADLT